MVIPTRVVNALHMAVVVREKKRTTCRVILNLVHQGKKKLVVLPTVPYTHPLPGLPRIFAERVTHNSTLGSCPFPSASAVLTTCIREQRSIDNKMGHSGAASFLTNHA